MCRLALIPFFFFSIFQRSAFSIKPEVAGLFKTSRDPTPIHTALQLWRNKKLTSGLEGEKWTFCY